MQAEPCASMRSAYAQFGDAAIPASCARHPSYREAFLRIPEGAFYTSQDADSSRASTPPNTSRSTMPHAASSVVPAVDTNSLRARERLDDSGARHAYTVTGEAAYLDDARAAARWMLAHRILSGGGFRHGETDSPAPTSKIHWRWGGRLSHCIRQALIAQWLAQAQRSAAFIEAHFRDPRSPATPLPPAAARASSPPRTPMRTF